MADNDNGSLIKIILERLIYAVFALVIFAVMFLFGSVSKLNSKIDSVNQNEASIQKLWQKYGELNEKVSNNKIDIEVIKSGR